MVWVKLLVDHFPAFLWGLLPVIPDGPQSLRLRGGDILQDELEVAARWPVQRPALVTEVKEIF